MSRVARAVLSIALLAAILAYVGPAEILAPLAEARPGWVLASFAAITFDRWLMTLKWIRLLSSRGIQLPVLAGLKIYCTSMLLGLLLPSTLGADALRTYLTARRGIETRTIVASIVVERMIGFIASLLVGLLGLLILRESGLLDARFAMLRWLGPLLLGAAVAGFALSLHRGAFERARTLLPARLGATRLAARIAELHHSYAAFGASPGLLAEFTALTLLEQLTTIAGAWLTALSVGVDVSLWFMAGVLPLTNLAARLPISVAGLGVFESIFLLLMGLGGVPPGPALSIVLMGWLIQTASWLPWCLAELIESGPVRLAANRPETRAALPAQGSSR